MEKLRPGNLIQLRIQDYAFGGKGIGRIPTAEGDLVVFVQNALPDQLVEARVVKAKKRYAECKLVKVLERAADEVEIPFQEIPGAPYARLPVENQRKLKEEAAFGLYERIGKVQNVRALYDEWIESPLTWHYRNKMEYSFSSIQYERETDKETDAFSLGFKKRGSWWAVENLNRDSGLFDAQVETKLWELREYLESTGLAAWNPRKREGFFKNLIVRKSFAEDTLMIHLITHEDPEKRFDAQGFVDQCLSCFGDRVASVFHGINDQTGDRSSLEAKHIQLLYGVDHVTEQLNGLEFRIGVQSFFQPNPRCAELLYAKAVEYAMTAGLRGEAMLDLFCGTGTITQLLAQKVTGRTITGVEIIESAVEDARENATRNDLNNVDFHTGDVGKFLYAHPEMQNNIALVMMDPPRAGIAPKTLEKVIRLGAHRMVYISCNPATQARDCERLIEAGYQLKKLSLVDQFPHTSHVEAVALFDKPDNV